MTRPVGSAGSADPTILMPPIDPRYDHIQGPPDAPVTLTEYGDYECPYCARADIVVTVLLRRSGGRLRYAFRHFPLVALHPHATAAAEAAEAAGAQGRFWPMHHLLLNNQHRLDPVGLIRHAQRLRLDEDRFVDDLRRRRHLRRISRDVLSGARSGVDRTPTLFINGSRHNGAYDLPSLEVAIRAAASSVIEPEPRSVLDVSTRRATRA